MNIKLAVLSAALLAIAPLAYAQDSDSTGNTGTVGDTTQSDTTISGSGDADTEGQHGETLADDGAASSDLEDMSPAAGSDYFDQWDTDQDGSLSEDEFNMGFEQYQMENQ